MAGWCTRARASANRFHCPALRFMLLGASYPRGVASRSGEAKCSNTPLVSGKHWKLRALGLLLNFLAG